MPQADRARGIIRPRTRQRRINYQIIGQRIGSGAFGKVYRAQDDDTGAVMAMKVVNVRGVPGEADHLKKLRNEVDILAQSRHSHIVEFITSEGWSKSEIRIFMSLKDGTLAGLAAQCNSSSLRDVYKTALYHMLQALDYLAMQNIVHRDMKPDNILYSTVQGRFHFQLGDFGLAAEARSSVGFYGTPVFMAPEVIYGKTQTPKLDVWSLYLTILWVLDEQGFREKCRELDFHRGAERLFQGISSLVWPIPTRLRNLQAMVQVDASNRASAGDMLQQLYQGQGRSTPNADPPRQERRRQERAREERPRHERPRHERHRHERHGEERHREERHREERHREERHHEERHRRQERVQEPSPYNIDVLGWAIDIDIAAQRRELERYNAAMGFNDEPRRPVERAPRRVADPWAREPEEPDYDDMTNEMRRRMDPYRGGFDPFGPARRYM